MFLTVRDGFLTQTRLVYGTAIAVSSVMTRPLRRLRRRLVFPIVVAALVVSGSTFVSAQEQEGSAASIAKGVFFDAETYIPAALLFTSMRLDWTSSQPLFEHGFIEGN